MKAPCQKRIADLAGGVRGKAKKRKGAKITIEVFNNKIQIIFYSTPFWGRVYKWKFCLSICLSVCLSSLLILFLQTLSSRNIPQSTLITQPLPRLTSGVELCVNLTFFIIRRSEFCCDLTKKITFFRYWSVTLVKKVGGHLDLFRLLLKLTFLTNGTSPRFWQISQIYERSLSMPKMHKLITLDCLGTWMDGSFQHIKQTSSRYIKYTNCPKVALVKTVL